MYNCTFSPKGSQSTLKSCIQELLHSLWKYSCLWGGVGLGEQRNCAHCAQSLETLTHRDDGWGWGAQKIIPRSQEHRIKGMITVAGEGGAQAAVAGLSTIWGILALAITGEQSYHHCRASLQLQPSGSGMSSLWCSSGWWGGWAESLKALSPVSPPAVPRSPRDNPSCVSRKPQENGSIPIDISVVGNWMKLYKNNAIIEEIRKCMDVC